MTDERIRQRIRDAFADERCNLTVDDIIQRALRLDDVEAPDRFDEIQQRVVRAEQHAQHRAERRRMRLTTLGRVVAALALTVTIGLALIGAVTIYWWALRPNCLWWGCI